MQPDLLLLDEPTNHLDIDSKEVLLDALADYGGTLIFVSHDRYFVEKLATKIVNVGDGKAVVYPGKYSEFLWSQTQRPEQKPITVKKIETKPVEKYEDRKEAGKEQRRKERAIKALKDRVADLEVRIAEKEKAIKDVEAKMAAPDFYNNHETSKPILDQHQTLMWEVGELLNQWEMLQSEAETDRGAQKS